MRRLISLGLVSAALAISISPAGASEADAGRVIVSARPDGATGNDHSSHRAAPALVEHGGTSVPVFSSWATDLVANDTNRYSDIFAVVDGEVELMTRSFLGDGANGQSQEPVASPAGDAFAFTSYATNLVVDDLDKTFLSGSVQDSVDTSELGSPGDIFLADFSGHITKVSVGLDGLPANETSSHPAIGGTHSEVVAFESDASNLVAGDTNEGSTEAFGTDVFVRNMDTGVTERISVDPAGAEDSGGGYAPDISADGNLVVFHTLSGALAPNDENGRIADVVIRDLRTDTTTLVSTTSEALQGSSGSWNASISGNGRFVAFESYSRLHPTDTDDLVDIYVKDLLTGETRLVSGSEGASCSPTIDAEGSVVAFHTILGSHPAFPCSDGSGSNVYAYFLERDVSVLVSASVAGNPVTGFNGFAEISADASRIAFASDSPDLVDGDANGKWDAFVQPLIAPQVLPPAVTIAVTSAVGSSHTVRLEATIQDPDGLADVASAAVSIVDRKGRTLGSWSLADFAASGGVLQLVADVDLKGPGSFTATISATDSGGLATSTSTIFAR